MIPVKLTLKNFMCYRDNVPPLSFEGIHVACLCGDNGHGKSALLDAMTWALWGRARARSHDDLVYQGQAEMEVEFEFDVGGARYRVIRKYARGKPGRSGQHLLELQIAAEDGFRPISGGGLRETEDKVKSILRMDYQTFTNSAFLVQGRADEFTHQLDPRERKEILARILGLSFYDELEARARGHGRDRESQRKGLELEIIRIEEDLGGKPELEAQMEQGSGDLTRLEGEIGVQETDAAALRLEKQTLEGKREQLRELDRGAEETLREMEEWEGRSREYAQRVEEYEGTRAQAQTIEEGYARLVAARKRDESLNEKLRALNTIGEEGKPLREAVQRAREDLLRELERARSRAEELQKSCRKLPQLRKEQELQQARLAGLASRKTDLEAKKEQAQGIFEHIRHLEADNATLKGEMNGLKEKLDLLAPAQSRCPLCGTGLDTSAREKLESSYQTEGRSKADTYRSHQKTLEGLQGEHKALDGEVRSLEAGLQSEAAPEQARQLALEKEVREAEEAAAMLVEAEASRGELQQRWSSTDFAPVETKRLRELEAEARELQYDDQGHRAAQEEMEETKGFEDRKHRLDEAERSIPMQKSDLDRALAEVSTRRQRLEAGQQRKQSLGAELASLPQVALRLEEAEGGLALQVSRKTRMQRDLVELEVKLRRLQDREREHGEKATRKKRALEEEQIYKELAEAFGKGGIQAQLIEYALPEIEVEANRLLGRMTDNRMHLKIDTQRPIKSRKEEMAETLVIEIADELGTRNYEMFSGGEAFRINLALRIALSKLLAHRAGAPLPTLIIDEGFGSQDTAGREKLVDAINSIQDDFEKIIVITHIEEMKDLFPVRINVIKTAEGSTIQVS